MYRFAGFLQECCAFCEARPESGEARGTCDRCIGCSGSGAASISAQTLIALRASFVLISGRYRVETHIHKSIKQLSSKFLHIPPFLPPPYDALC